MISPLLLDPSLLMSRRGVSWLETLRYASEKLAISDAFANVLYESNPELLFAFAPPFMSRNLWREQVAELSPTLRDSLRDVRRVKTSDFDLDESELAVASQLVIDGNEVAGKVWAEEFAYLVSESVMGSARRACLDAFARAGAVVVQYGDHALDEFMSYMIPAKRVPNYDGIPMFKRVGIKWLIYGGAMASAAILGGPVAAAAAATTRPLIRAIDP